ncbi:hypothetical protein P4637_11205 [Halalkalibacterium halodurans]|jgi:hypothetical protein|uniref:BH1102 protein n=2 Tax=Halalkalibacterium halodurans TaxID=86665 RepID=Q9KDV9_HALH5|nr:hypothetical protein [Halalkalibacterium halodurans]MDY7221635.1 hypothetical protein [Halalkalibacterium halodurans]MDY7240911.1 hypothetical protein [Halalkalibacterium halodurans]MED3645481.1 hypothetical protein [Halalkalibacterium halodurans]MED4079306.1 hypothetical protein [Halalkalibacterium halodurans]MED4085377.1 hypothetical protein [Halalkalibacterium halodurans]
MVIKLIVMIVVYAVILGYDIPKLKEKEGKTIGVYTGLMFVALYQSLIFVFDLDWPFLHTAVDALFREPARHIVEFLEAPPS